MCTVPKTFRAVNTVGVTLHQHMQPLCPLFHFRSKVVVSYFLSSCLILHTGLLEISASTCLNHVKVSTDAHLCLFPWEQLLRQLTRLCSPCSLCGRWVRASPSNTACPVSLCTSSGWCPPTTAVLCLEGPAGPAWRREGGPSVPSPATWLPRGEGGVEGGGAKEAGQQEKETFSLLFLYSFFSFYSWAFFYLINSFLPHSS